METSQFPVLFPLDFLIAVFLGSSRIVFKLHVCRRAEAVVVSPNHVRMYAWCEPISRFAGVDWSRVTRRKYLQVCFFSLNPSRVRPLRERRVFVKPVFSQVSFLGIGFLCPVGQGAQISFISRTYHVST